MRLEERVWDVEERRQRKDSGPGAEEPVAAGPEVWRKVVT